MRRSKKQHDRVRNAQVNPTAPFNMRSAELDRLELSREMIVNAVAELRERAELVGRCSRDTLKVLSEALTKMPPPNLTTLGLNDLLEMVARHGLRLTIERP